MQLCLKNTPTEMFSRETCEIFRKPFFNRTLQLNIDVIKQSIGCTTIIARTKQNIYLQQKEKRTMIQAKFIKNKEIIIKILNTEAFTQRCCENKVFLEISQNSKENACARVSFLIKLQFY